MGIEDDFYYIKEKVETTSYIVKRIEDKLDRLLKQEQPKDRQSKEKVIKDSLRI